LRKILAVAASAAAGFSLTVASPAVQEASAATGPCTSTPFTAPANAAAITLTQPGGVAADQFQIKPTTGGYVLQNDEWDSTAAFKVTSTGSPELDVAGSSINNPTAGPPGAYASLFMGNHVGTCSPTAQDHFPVSIFTLHYGVLDSTSVTATQAPAAGSVWDNSYDIWLAPTSTVNQSAGGGLEIMVWLASGGGAQPAGFGNGPVMTDVGIGGGTFNAYYSPPSSSTTDGTLSFVRTANTASLSFGFDEVLDAALGYNGVNANWYVIDTEVGFEIWKGGAGLAIKSFSVTSEDVG
jgi:hypothetical protein